MTYHHTPKAQLENHLKLAAEYEAEAVYRTNNPTKTLGSPSTRWGLAQHHLNEAMKLAKEHGL